MRKLICGVGINDADYVVNKSRKDGSRIICPYYSIWRTMLTRCVSMKRKEISPTYKDVSICEEWHLFSNFKKWMEQQPWEGMQIDKDLLVRGNKIYSPDACVFVPAKNKFPPSDL